MSFSPFHSLARCFVVVRKPAAERRRRQQLKEKTFFRGLSSLAWTAASVFSELNPIGHSCSMLISTENRITGVVFRETSAICTTSIRTMVRFASPPLAARQNELIKRAFIMTHLWISFGLPGHAGAVEKKEIEKAFQPVIGVNRKWISDRRAVLVGKATMMRLLSRSECIACCDGPRTTRSLKVLCRNLVASKQGDSIKHKQIIRLNSVGVVRRAPPLMTENSQHRMSCPKLSVSGQTRPALVANDMRSARVKSHFEANFCFFAFASLFAFYFCCCAARSISFFGASRGGEKPEE